jgi:hypothetical protein
MPLKYFLTPQATLAVALVLLSGCQTRPDIRTTADPAVNLSGYLTYGFEFQAGSANDVNADFEAAISRELNARGYVRVDSNPNLLVRFKANVQERALVDSTPGPLSGAYYGARAGMSTPIEVTTVRSQLGTANVDLIDTRLGKVVWSGTAEGMLSNAAVQNPQPVVDTAVTQMFAQFPGRAGASWGHSAAETPASQSPLH